MAYPKWYLKQLGKPIAETVPVELDAAMIFIDDTGLPSEVSQHHPVFGMAGILVRSEDYAAQVAAPWRILKREVLKINGRPAHAMDYLPKLADDQRDALVAFLNGAMFAKVGAFVSLKTRRETPEPLLSSVGESLGNCASLAVRDRAPKLARWIIEYSDALYGLYIGSAVQPPHLGGMEIPNRFTFMRKESQEPGLEIADLVTTVQGTNWRKHLAKKPLVHVAVNAAMHNGVTEFFFSMFESGWTTVGPDGVKIPNPGAQLKLDIVPVRQPTPAPRRPKS